MLFRSSTSHSHKTVTSPSSRNTSTKMQMGSSMGAAAPSQVEVQQQQEETQPALVQLVQGDEPKILDVEIRSSEEQPASRPDNLKRSFSEVDGPFEEVTKLKVARVVESTVEGERLVSIRRIRTNNETKSQLTQVLA